MRHRRRCTPSARRFGGAQGAMLGDAAVGSRRVQPFACRVSHSSSLRGDGVRPREPPRGHERGPRGSSRCATCPASRAATCSRALVFRATGRATPGGPHGVPHSRPSRAATCLFARGLPGRRVSCPRWRSRGSGWAGLPAPPKFWRIRGLFLRSAS
uniref:Uncharacterized protein n=1 Tax=Arundo donax TaxID=35708 RepID=A0A0A8XN33_ARUDO